MKFRAERHELAEAVGWATRAVSSRVTMPTLAGILLEATEDRLICRATDLEVATEIGVPVQAERSGRVLLLGRLLNQLIAKLPDQPVEVEGTADQVRLRCGRASFEVRAMPVEDFPALPPVDADAPRGSIKAEAFTRLVSQVARAASQEEGRPALTGVQLVAGGGRLKAVATDSYRLALRTIPWDQQVEGQALVPARALQETARAAAEVGGAVTVVFEDTQASFLLEDRRITTRLIDLDFPEYERLLPDSYDTLVVVDRHELTEAVGRVAVLITGQANLPVQLRIGDGTVEVSAGSQEIGSGSEPIPAEIEGPELDIAFNPTFLLSGLEGCGTEQVRIELRDGLKPAVIRPQTTGADESAIDDYMYLLMPMRV